MRLLEAETRAQRIRAYAPTIVVLAISLSLASFFTWMARGDALARAEAAFKLEVRLARAAIVDVMRTYEQSLRAGAGLAEAAGPLTRRDWSIFVRSLALPENFPGSQGLGYVRIVAADQIDTLVAEQRKDGLSGYAFRPLGRRPLYTAIVHLEPLDWRNEQALGFDMFSEPVRRAAMERARDTGDPSLSQRVTLMQETEDDQQPGTLLYMPFYTGGGRPDSVEARRERIAGWVYGVFRMRDFFSQSLRRHAPGALARLRLEIFDGDPADSGALLFDSLASSGQQPGSAVAPRSKFVENYALTVAGARWTLRASTLPGAEGLVDWRRPLSVFWVGLLCSGLLAAISGVLDYSRHRYALAERQLKDEVVERKRAEEAAQLANQELIHRVKNTLAVVTAIASQTGRHTATIEEFNRAFRSRLTGLARVQDLLNPNAAHEADLESFSRGLLAPYVGTRPDALTTDGPLVSLNHNEATLLSLVLNELATNATKYGAWSVPTGRVELGWRMSAGTDRRMIVDWQERGGPPVEPPRTQGFGSSVMRVAIERGLRGSLTTDYDAGGIRYTMTVPRSAVELTAEGAVGETG
jgi:two-component sensor histidine kinase/CHASE1-domain containing sensor protein